MGTIVISYLHVHRVCSARDEVYLTDHIGCQLPVRGFGRSIGVEQEDAGKVLVSTSGEKVAMVSCNQDLRVLDVDVDSPVLAVRQQNRLQQVLNGSYLAGRIDRGVAQRLLEVAT